MYQSPLWRFAHPYFTDSAAMAWALAVVRNGGTVSADRLALVSTLISALKASGSWALRDDCGLTVAENATQALVSLKQRRLGTVTNAPTFTTDRGYAFDGATNFINTGFIPNTHCTVATINDMRIEAYARANVQSDTYIIGASSLSNRNMYIRPRTTADLLSIGLSYNASAAGNCVALSPADARGLSGAQRVAAGSTSDYDKNGVSLGSVSPSYGTLLVAFALYLGATNSSGTAAAFNAGTIGWWSVGGSLSAAQKASDYAAIQAYMTAVGANV